MMHKGKLRAKSKVEIEPKRRTTSSGREIISIKDLLEWAFATECATLDFDEIGEAQGGSMPGVGSEWRIGQMLELGLEPGEGVKVDTSFGRSLPHNDAELVATVVRNALNWWEAVSVAELARQCRAPDWDLGPLTCQPEAWGKRNHHGQMGKTKRLEDFVYTKGGRTYHRQVLMTPIKFYPDVSNIAAARRKYLNWISALMSVRAAMRGHQMERFILSDTMPNRAPWKKRC